MAAAACVLFLACSGVIAVQMASGHDPVLAKTASARPASASGSTQGTAAANGYGPGGDGPGSFGPPGANGPGFGPPDTAGSGSATAQPSPVTTAQS